jgi:Lhr-like helicase
LLKRSDVKVRKYTKGQIIVLGGTEWRVLAVGERSVKVERVSDGFIRAFGFLTLI